MTTLRKLYNKLGDEEKANARTAWKFRFGQNITDETFRNRLDRPMAADYAFWSKAYNMPLEELMADFFTENDGKHIPVIGTKSFALSLGLTQAR